MQPVGTTGRPAGRARLLVRPLSAWAIILLLMVSVQSAAQEDPVTKFGQILNQVQEIVDTLSGKEVGLKELLERLPQTVASDVKVSNRCNDLVNRKNTSLVTERWTPLFAGYLNKMTAKDLVGLVSEKLAKDGFKYLAEKDSGGIKTVYWYNEGPDRPRKKRYLLQVNEGWWEKLKNKIGGRSYTGSFWLIKIEKV